ncbi:hypothetical protein RJ639_047642 [Escallonia herrerae]|uniref:Rx N-terminal domain-containing protein n=1 Tax=Escallonia herrerae TaxID=1293975 RepID=A0AA88WFG9_9ASTE|nr:hypothetical protein RJ639_047642 [Escallonia herrerae]
MAEIIISPLLQVVFDKLASPMMRSLQFSRDYMKEVEKLRAALAVVQAVIEDAEVKQQKVKKVRIWLRNLKEVACDIDELLDKFNTQALQRRIKANKVRWSCLALKPFPSNNTSRKLKMIRRRLDDVAREMSQFQFAECMEDTGSEYFNDLQLVSFFQAVNNRDDNGQVKFKMHALIHDLAKSIAGNEFLILGHESSSSTLMQDHHSSGPLSDLAQVRHASVVCKFNSAWIPEALYAANKLRTLRLFSLGNDSDKVVPSIFRVFRHLRVLDLSGSGIRKLQKSIGSLIYLRYLDLSDTFVETLPKTICHLCNLQTLDVTRCHDLMNLPKGITKLMNLRHLIIKDCTRLTRMPSLKMLQNLQTLPVFIVGNKFEESLFQLVHLNLRGELKIRNLKKVGNVIPDLCLEQKQLYSLKLSWGNDEKSDLFSSSQSSEGCPSDSGNAEALLNCLQPNDSLRKLFLNGYLGVTFPQWMNNITLPSLTDLVLTDCKNCVKLPALGQLPFLKTLSMQGMNAIVNIAGEFYGKESKEASFPSLKKLTVKNFTNLDTWESPAARKAFVCLDTLTIIGCPNLETMPRFPSLLHLELRNCNGRILRSAAELDSLSTVVIDIFPELFHLPQGLLQNSPLTSLTISSCPQLSSLPWDLRGLVALKSLTLRWCEELCALPRAIRDLTSLESLEITECPSLISLPEEGIQGLCSLRSLSIENCCNLTSLPKAIRFLIALERLTIMYSPNIAALPDELQHLSVLRSLNILSCQELGSLPEGLQHVTTLENLEICSCPNLTELPEWMKKLVSLRSLTISDCQNIRSIPTGIESLTELQHLSVRDSPDLERRCEESKGEDWIKISHIPYIYIGSSVLHNRHTAATKSSS